VIVPSTVLHAFVERALAEDIGRGDATTQALFHDAVSAEGRIRAKTPIVMAGGAVAALVFQTLDPTTWATLDTEDGESVNDGTTLLTIRGDGRSILTAERVALNILQRLCGIATLTRQFVDAVRGFSCRITDTRKTPAGWRLLDKYAVRCGGGSNHRFGLDDGILIKDTHLALAGGIAESVRRAKSESGYFLKVEVEVSTVEGAREAVEGGADASRWPRFGILPVLAWTGSPSAPSPTRRPPPISTSTYGRADRRRRPARSRQAGRLAPPRVRRDFVNQQRRDRAGGGRGAARHGRAGRRPNRRSRPRRA
jgi:nicotinate-nucleotide pyrophosphorylase (carboxylating)